MGEQERIDDGGAAFPIGGIEYITNDGAKLNPYDGYGWDVKPQSGMSKRELIVMHMLASVGTWMPDYRPNGEKVTGPTNLCNPDRMSSRAEWAVAQADELLAALARAKGVAGE